MDWGEVDRILVRVPMLPGENQRDHVLGVKEEIAYLKAANQLGQNMEQEYEQALSGIRATKRGEQPRKPDAFLLPDMTTILIDCGLRPEECFRLRWTNIRDGALHIFHGKTENARRVIPMTPRVLAMIEMRRTAVNGEWVFPASTKTCHVEKSSLRKQHKKACNLAEVAPFPLYSFRHTCLTRWAVHMDPYPLAYLAGHADFATTKRYVHPQAHTILEAMERARNNADGHSFSHSDQKPVGSTNPGMTDKRMKQERCIDSFDRWHKREMLTG
jgi:integrase